MSDWMGFLLVVMAGIVTGTYFLGLKYVAPWKWENIWLAYAVLALVAMPLGMALVTVPRLAEVFGSAPGGGVARVVLFGAGWGVGSVLSGLGVARLGMALGVSVMVGVNAAVGAFVPMAINTPDIVFQKKGLMVIAAVVTLLVSVGMVGFAGKQREVTQASAGAAAPPGNFAAGIAICAFSGVFSAMMNFAFAFGGPVARAAVGLGATEPNALNAVWLLTLFGGFIPTALYTGYLLTRNHTWGLFRRPRTGRFWLIGLGMALLWYLGVIFYGRGADGMGRLGPVIGWPLFMGVLIFASSVSGFLTREWKGASRNAKSWMGAGLAILLAATALLGVANQL